MKFSVKIVSKSGQALKLPGVGVEIHGVEPLSVRNAILHHSAEDNAFTCETYDFSDDEEVTLVIANEKMCRVKNGETIIVTILYEEQKPPKPRRKKAHFIGKKT